MIFIIAVFLIAYAIASFVIYHDEKGTNTYNSINGPTSDINWGWVFGFSIFPAVVAAVVIGGVGSTIAGVHVDPELKVNEWDTPIVALADGDSTHVNGSGFLFVNITSDNVSYYNYMVRNEDGTLRRGQLNSDNVVIEESNEGSPHIHSRCNEYEAEWFWVLGRTETDVCYYRIVIPEDSVVNDFNVDLE